MISSRLLDGSESNFSHPVHGKDVVVMASQASGIDQEGVGSSMVSLLLLSIFQMASVIVSVQLWSPRAMEDKIKL